VLDDEARVRRAGRRSFIWGRKPKWDLRRDAANVFWVLLRQHDLSSVSDQIALVDIRILVTVMTDAKRTLLSVGTNVRYGSLADVR
jgi:hypothetical protein